jgi:hypothetical protein
MNHTVRRSIRVDNIARWPAASDWARWDNNHHLQAQHKITIPTHENSIDNLIPREEQTTHYRQTLDPCISHHYIVSASQQRRHGSPHFETKYIFEAKEHTSSKTAIASLISYSKPLSVIILLTPTNPLMQALTSPLQLGEATATSSKGHPAEQHQHKLVFYSELVTSKLKLWW